MAVRGKRMLWVIPVGAVLVIVGVFAVVGLVQAQQTAAQLPPKSASAEQVLRVYLRAGKAHNCALDVALSTGANEPSAPLCGSNSWNPFNEDPDLLSYKNIGPVQPVSAADTGSVAEDCIQVDVTETDMNGAAPGELPGWQFCFVRTPGGWRLYDSGYG